MDKDHRKFSIFTDFTLPFCFSFGIIELRKFDYEYSFGDKNSLVIYELIFRGKNSRSLRSSFHIVVRNNK